MHEPWWTATAQRADIVLPATTPYEREDLGRAMGDSYLFNMPKLIEPVDEARDDFDIFAGIAGRLGLETEFTQGPQFRAVAAPHVRRIRRTRHFGWSRRAGLRRVAPTQLGRPAAARRATRNDSRSPGFAPILEANPLQTPSGRIEIFSETIDGFGYDDCPGHPSWQTPDEWLGAGLASRFPLHLVSPQPGDKLHSQMEPALADRQGARPGALEINPADASERGIADGDLVRVFNARGACRARAHLSTDIRAGVVSLPTGPWFDTADDGIDLQGNPNILTRDIGTSRIGQGSSAHTTLVDVERLQSNTE